MSKKVKLIGEDALAHYGVLGMKWGVRKARSGGGVAGLAGQAAAKAVLGKHWKNPESAKSVATTLRKNLIISDKGVASFKKDMASVKALGSKVINSKAFKALVYDKDNTTLGVLKKSEVEKGKASVKKLLENKAFKAMVYDKDNTVGLIFKKSEIERLKAKLKDKKDAAADKWNRGVLKDQQRAIAEARARGNEQEAKDLQEELDYMFTPEEQKKYSS